MEEKKGLNAAKVFFEKGFDNLYLLTGGLEEFHSFFPEYVEGANVPEPKPLGKLSCEFLSHTKRPKDPGEKEDHNLA